MQTGTYTLKHKKRHAQKPGIVPGFSRMHIIYLLQSYYEPCIIGTERQTLPCPPTQFNLNPRSTKRSTLNMILSNQT